MDNLNQPQRRTIRSFVLREGRMTPAQKKSLQDLWPTYGLEFEKNLLDLASTFPQPALANQKKLVMDIGFGMGDALFESLVQNPSSCFIGVEVHGPGVGHLMKLVERNSLNNLRIYRHDVVEVLTYCIPNAELDKVQIFFPDPWHKKRHNKRRLIQKDFVELLAGKIKPGGVLHLATDWQSYADQMLDVVGSSDSFTLSSSVIERPTTKYEQRAQRLGHKIVDLVYSRQV